MCYLISGTTNERNGENLGFFPQRVAKLYIIMRVIDVLPGVWEKQLEGLAGLVDDLILRRVLPERSERRRLSGS